MRLIYNILSYHAFTNKYISLQNIYVKLCITMSKNMPIFNIKMV